MSVSFSFARGRYILVPVRMKHATEPQWPVMVLDTAARTTVIDPKMAAALGLEPEESGPTVNVVGATGATSAALLTVNSVSVLGLDVRDLDVICHQLPSSLGLHGVLGLNFLRHFKIVIDNETETVILTKW